MTLNHDLMRQKKRAINLQDPKKGRRQPSFILFSWSADRGRGFLRFQEGLRLLNRLHRRPLEGARTSCHLLTGTFNRNTEQAGHLNLLSQSGLAVIKTPNLQTQESQTALDRQRTS